MLPLFVRHSCLSSCLLSSQPEAVLCHPLFNKQRAPCTLLTSMPAPIVSTKSLLLVASPRLQHNTIMTIYTKTRSRMRIIIIGALLLHEKVCGNWKYRAVHEVGLETESGHVFDICSLQSMLHADWYLRMQAYFLYI